MYTTVLRIKWSGSKIWWECQSGCILLNTCGPLRDANLPSCTQNQQVPRGLTDHSLFEILCLFIIIISFFLFVKNKCRFKACSNILVILTENDDNLGEFRYLTFVVYKMYQSYCTTLPIYMNFTAPLPSHSLERFTFYNAN